MKRTMSLHHAKMKFFLPVYMIGIWNGAGATAFLKSSRRLSSPILNGNLQKIYYTQTYCGDIIVNLVGSTKPQLFN